MRRSGVERQFLGQLEVAALQLRPESHAKLMRDNALAVFDRLPGAKAAAAQRAGKRRPGK